jgi:hypothetical protein
VDRREELRKLVKKTNADVIYPVIDKMLFLEKTLETLEGLPMIKVSPDDPQRQKATPAAKMYKEFLQQYTNCVKVVSHAIGDDGKEEDSPLRAWVKSRNAD